MAINVMLPTQQLHQTDNNNAFANHQRAVAFHGNESIPFQVNPADNLKYAEQAIGAIDKWQEQVRKDKEDALVTKASNTYLEAITQRKNEYTNLQGENAVNGFEQYTKDLDNIQKQFSKVFKNTEMQGELNKQNERNSIGARLDGKNWHDKQVYTMQEKELLSQADLLGQQYITNLDSPVSNINEQSLTDSLAKYLDFKGVPADSAQRIIATQEFYYNAFKNSLQSEIKHNPGTAIRKLNRVKHLLAEDKYISMLADAQDRAETLALRDLNRQNMELERKERINRLQIQEANKKRQPMGAGAKLKLEEDIRQQVFNDPRYKGMDGLSKAKIAQTEYNMRVVADKLACDEYNDATQNANNIIESAVQVAIQNGTYDSRNPRSIFGSDQTSNAQLTMLSKFYGGGEKLDEVIKLQYENQTITPSNELMAKHLFNLDYESFYNLLGNNTLDEYCIANNIQLSPSDRNKILNKQEENRLSMENGAGHNKMYKKAYDSIMTADLGVKQSQVNSSENYKQQAIASKLAQKVVREVQRTGDYSDNNFAIIKSNIVKDKLNGKAAIDDQVTAVDKNARKAVTILKNDYDLIPEKEGDVLRLAESLSFNEYQNTDKILSDQDIANRLIEINQSYQSLEHKFLGRGFVDNLHTKTPGVVLSEEAEARANRTDYEKAMDLPFLRNE